MHAKVPGRSPGLAEPTGTVTPLIHVSGVLEAQCTAPISRSHSPDLFEVMFACEGQINSLMFHLMVEAAY